jgi:predicted dehydrogenase
MKIGIIGYGYWGPNLVRNFSGIGSCTIKKVADQRKERLDVLAKSYPGIEGVMTADDIIADPEIDAVVIATPVFTHYEIARKALDEGKHVLIEKPMTSTSEQALGLIELAAKKQKVLMVDHTFLYTGAVQKIKELIDSGELGNINYFDSSRINLGLFQPDINVLWDLAPHDISILSFLYKESPYSVHATGTCHTGNGIENIAYLTVNYESGFIAHFNCSWSSPVKIRLLLIGGDKKMIVFNDLEPTEKIKVYDTGYKHTTDEEQYRIRVDYRSGDIYIPKINMKEALSGMAADFVSAIINKTTPVSDFNSGLEVIRILEASQVSIKNNGKEVILKR